MFIHIFQSKQLIMGHRGILIIWLSIGLPVISIGQQNGYSLNADLTISPEIRSSVKPVGRLFVFLTRDPDIEPRKQLWPISSNVIFARNLKNFGKGTTYQIKDSAGWTKTAEWTLGNIPEGTYFLQVLWDQDLNQSGIDEPGNIYCEKRKIVIDQPVDISIKLDKITTPEEIIKNDLVKVVTLKSDTLTAWWGKPVYIKASILLPGKYLQSPDMAYPIRYNVAGYGGRYTRINRLVQNKDFMDWWLSGEAPRIINVFLDGDGPFGDSYQMDSENSGPYGYSLIHELIPYIENKYRGTDSPETRFVDGCSTGGWVSLGLQLYYPDSFNGAFSYSPDAVEFEHYQLINIYKDKNAFINEYGNARPVMRDTQGEPIMTIKKYIRYENVLGPSNTYLNSGGQFSAHTALYSPKGEDGLPKPLFDPITGEIDHEVAEAWKKYDFKIYAEEHWNQLGPKIQGKIFIWMGDMDNFYLNLATRAFDDFLKSTKNPKSDAQIIFTSREGHCAEYSHRTILEQISKKIDKIDNSK